jgi:hypothetical protein
MINASSSGSDFKPVDAGTYVARCYSMVHIGTIEQEYMGEIKEMNKVRISWELPTELKVFKEEKGEQPCSVSKEFTLSLHEKANLRKFLESWRGKGFTDEEAKIFNVTNLLGKPCMISIIHKTSKNGKLYAEISAVSTLPKGMTCPAQINENFEFTFTPYTPEKFDELPDWLKDKIKTSKEYRALNEPENTDTNSEIDDPSLPNSNDDLPF